MAESTRRSRRRNTSEESEQSNALASNNRGGGSHLSRGRAARQRSQQEQQEAQKRREKAQNGTAFVNRFRMKPGEEVEIIILDHTIDDIPHLHEHSVPGPGNDWKSVEHHVCPKDWDHCPLCEKAQGAGKDSRFKPSHYMFALTVIDTRGFTTRDGKEIPHSKKLFCVKSSSHDEFYRLMDVAMKNHGTIRGMSILLNRAGANDANTGKPTIDDSGQMFSMLSEDELVDEFGHEAVKADDGKVIRPKNFDITVFPYEEVFEEPDVNEMRRKFGGSAPAGSSQSFDEEWGDEDEEQEQERPRRARRGRTRQAPEPSDDEGEDDGQEQEEQEAQEAPAPRRSRSRSRTRSGYDADVNSDDSPL